MCCGTEQEVGRQTHFTAPLPEALPLAEHTCTYQFGGVTMPLPKLGSRRQAVCFCLVLQAESKVTCWVQCWGGCSQLQKQTQSHTREHPVLGTGSAAKTETEGIFEKLDFRVLSTAAGCHPALTAPSPPCLSRQLQPSVPSQARRGNLVPI